MLEEKVGNLLDFLHRTLLLQRQLLQTDRLVKQEKSPFDYAPLLIVEYLLQLLLELLYNIRILNDVCHVLGQTVNAFWSDRIDNFAHAPIEQMLDYPSNLIKCQPVLDANCLKVLHGVENLDTVTKQGGRVRRKFHHNLLLRELENKRLIWQ